MRIVLDTNVLIAAALKGGLAESIIDMANEDLPTLIISQDILDELVHKLSSKFNWRQADIIAFSEKIREIGQLVSITQRVSVMIRDPSDNKILECALAGKANMIVSSDQDLIKLKNFEGIAIVHPKTLGWIFPQYFRKRKWRQ